MKLRSLAAVAAAMLVLALAPGSAGAAPTPGSLDQSVGPGASRYVSDAPLSQTFTAGQTGFLTHLELYCDSNEGGDVDVSLSVGTSTAHALCGNTAGWVDFLLSWSTPPQVISGQQYTIALSGGTVIGLAVSASDYAGGAASASGAPIPGVSDFAFRTYVYTASTTTYAWSVPQVTAGSTTAVTLTAATTFHPTADGSADRSLDSGAVAPNPAASLDYTVKLDAVPAWFTATGITCSAQIAPADCTFANFTSGLHVLADSSAMTVTVAVTGQASPAAAEAGSTRIAGGEGCIAVTDTELGTFHLCSTGSAGLVVVAAGATPPPTTTGVSGSSGDSPPLWWPVGLLALICSLFAIAGCRVRQVR